MVLVIFGSCVQHMINIKMFVEVEMEMLPA